MTANIITLSRAILVFPVIALFRQHPYLDIVLIATIGVIFIGDAIDGYIARKRNQVSETGAILDTVADRIVENVFWIYFAWIKLIPVIIPIIVVARGFLTDGVRSITPATAESGKIAHAITRSRYSRAVSGFTKMIAFIYLAVGQTYKHWNPTKHTLHLDKIGLILALLAVFVCLVRGIPAVIDGWKAIVDYTD